MLSFSSQYSSYAVFFHYFVQIFEFGHRNSIYICTVYTNGCLHTINIFITRGVNRHGQLFFFFSKCVRPKKFRFLPGDRKLMNAMAFYVTNTSEDETISKVGNKEKSSFDMPSDYKMSKKYTHSLTFGLVLRSKSAVSNTMSSFALIDLAVPNLEDYKRIVCQKVIGVVESLGLTYLFSKRVSEL